MNKGSENIVYTEVEEEDNSTIKEIKNPFNPKKIDIASKSLSVDLLIKRLNSNPPEIDLYPDFQRKGGIWSDTKQSRLIESLLIRLPLPAFYFDGSDDDKWLVVDGLQRLTTIKRFVIDKKLVLQNMEFLKVLNDKKFDQLPREFQRRIEETQIIAYIIKPGTPSAVKFNIFQRINTGGEPLTAQEIRHALNQGMPAKFVEKLSLLSSFKDATDNIRPDRMLDRDFVTRFVSFYLISYTEYEPDLDSFLNKGMNKLKNLSEEELTVLRNDFNNSMDAAKEIFGKYAFRKRPSKESNIRRRPLSKALFDALSVALAKLNDEERKTLITKKNKLEEKLIDLMNNNEEFHQAISQATGARVKVITRFKTIEDLIKKILSE